MSEQQPNNNNNHIEYIDVMNEDGTPTGTSLPRSEIHRLGIWHKVIHVWLVDCNGDVLIQQRAANKESFASMWDISCAGHIEAGMNSRDSAIKELSEELSVHLNNQEQLEYLFTSKKKFVLHNGKYLDNEIADVYLLTYDQPIDVKSYKLQVEEVQGVKLIKHSELRDMAERIDPTFVPLRLENQPFEECTYKQLFDYSIKREMSSGYGAFGGSGRCFPIWSDFTTCITEQSIELCEPYRTDYLECLHNFKEYKSRASSDYGKDSVERTNRVKEAIQQVQDYEAKVGKEC
ncbi:hypothetical protein DFA_12291 [Cavenderia fasciculata]|uniref:Nudix hydrolase domain-containing protein n=1 Tax=Cavenderia fasciculata TaxID=261658 RepID=F4QD44_CACFS|nr:uncharacterized protein DFA_12291 [Cavenderia fasciculata]EGG14515.1 hypothetical protein DFA_12291 [Cavenderia fasciculata]|eukprot:XP_004353933.1 hypothetical protein DFA_12291 [Cavenderia fasciculata]